MKRKISLHKQTEKNFNSSEAAKKANLDGKRKHNYSQRPSFKEPMK